MGYANNRLAMHRFGSDYVKEALDAERRDMDRNTYILISIYGYIWQTLENNR